MNIKLLAAAITPFILGILAPFGITGSTTVNELITIVIGGLVTGAMYLVATRNKTK